MTFAPGPDPDEITFDGPDSPWGRPDLSHGDENDGLSVIASLALKDRIRLLAAGRDLRLLKATDVIKVLDLSNGQKGTVRRLLRELAAEGAFERHQNARGAAARGPAEFTGTLRMSTRGFAFVIPDVAPPATMRPGAPPAPVAPREIFVPARRAADALNGDTVRVAIVDDSGKSPEGQVVEIVKRGTSRVVGLYRSGKKGGTVIPKDERIGRNLSVGRPDPRLGVSDGDFVVAEITEWTRPPEPLAARVAERLGDVASPGVDITLIVRGAGVEPEFPAHVTAAAEAIPPAIPDPEIASRTDFRALPTFTIDGATAKDFDDALSIERIPGGWRLGVHIADVSHYVHEGSPLDREAFDRATSIYPVDRVVPMLPESLSNGLCSLRPREDRLTLSCVMDVDANGRVGAYSVHRSVIRSAHRLVYEDVQAVMDGAAPPALAREMGVIRLQLEDLFALRRALTAMRHRRGALDLDIAETQVVFEGEDDPDFGRSTASMADTASSLAANPGRGGLDSRLGRPVIGLVRRPRLDAHRLVEECMLLANETVATHLARLGVPSVYRVHEPPDTRKLREIMPVLAQLGVKFPAKGDLSPAAIQGALDAAAKLETGFIARRLILRSMMRARYAPENLGHYGLASACYTHFTSPIRRYPDLLVHRILVETMEAGAPTTGVIDHGADTAAATCSASPDEASAQPFPTADFEIIDQIVPVDHESRRGFMAPNAFTAPDDHDGEGEGSGFHSPFRTGDDEPTSAPSRSVRPADHSTAPLPPERRRQYRQMLAHATAHCSERERRAADIEDDATKLKSYEFMRTKLGDDYEGVISGVTAFGFFIELIDLPVEGLVHVRNLKGDFYEFDEDRMMLVGRSGGETFKLGDKVLISVETVDLAALRLDFALISKASRTESSERRAELHRLRMAAASRNEQRRPKYGGFQARGRGKGKGRSRR